MIRKVVIPAAGLGTRLLPATKEQPKEMLPIFARGVNGKLCLKPLLQIVFESLYDSGFKEFCFIVGKKKRSIEDHFTMDNNFVDYLNHCGKLEIAEELYQFYKKIQDSSIAFINQPAPTGFGNAVYQAKSFTGGEVFLVHAGDDVIISKENHHLKRLLDVFEDKRADAVFFVEKMADPSRYGVIVGRRVEQKVYRVEKIVEKPSIPPSNLAAVGIYVFNPKIYQAIERTPPDENNETQLTDAIQLMLNEDCAVYAVELNQGEKRVDIGTPESYLAVLKEVIC